MDISLTKTVVLSAAVAAIVATASVFFEQSVPLRPFAKAAPPSSACNVLGVYVHGQIVTSATQLAPPPTDGKTLPPQGVVSRDVEFYLENGAADPAIRGLIVDVDSAGGGVVAGEEIASAIRRFGKPTVSVIRELGASSGYLAAASANTVFASANSSVGSIGATQSYVDNSEKNKKEGLVYNQLTTGKFKDAGSLDKPLTSDERALFMRDLTMLHDHFVALVAEFRGLPKEAVAKIADGSTMLGGEARSLGLIDNIGGLFEAEQFLGQKIGALPVICWANDPTLAEPSQK